MDSTQLTKIFLCSSLFIVGHFSQESVILNCTSNILNISDVLSCNITVVTSIRNPVVNIDFDDGTFLSLQLFDEVVTFGGSVPMNLSLVERVSSYGNGYLLLNTITTYESYLTGIELYGFNSGTIQITIFNCWASQSCSVPAENYADYFSIIQQVPSNHHWQYVFDLAINKGHNLFVFDNILYLMKNSIIRYVPDWTDTQIAVDKSGSKYSDYFHNWDIVKISENTENWRFYLRSIAKINSGFFNKTYSSAGVYNLSVSVINSTAKSYFEIIINNLTSPTSSDFDYDNLENILSLLTDQTYDVSSCLTNCSNNGLCKLNKLGTYQCECLRNFTGSSCQFDTNPCNRNPCINNSTCLIEPNNTNSFECICQHGFYGRNCEKIINLCQNISCSNNGYCMEHKSKTKCICKKYFNGEKCDAQDQQLVIIKAIISTSSIIAIIAMLCLYVISLLIDILSLIYKKDKPKKKPIRYYRMKFKYIS